MTNQNAPTYPSRRASDTINVATGGLYDRISFVNAQIHRAAQIDPDSLRDGGWLKYAEPMPNSRANDIVLC